MGLASLHGKKTKTIISVFRKLFGRKRYFNSYVLVDENSGKFAISLLYDLLKNILPSYIANEAFSNV